jgi:hypothetical protein
MNTDLTTAQLNADDLTAIKAALTTIESKLPFMQTLTQKERKALRKIGPERLSFVENSAQAAQNNPAILPASFNQAGFQSIVTLFSQLTEINTLTAQLASKVDDTHMKAGSLGLSGASDVYTYVKSAAKKTPGLKPLADQLGALNQKAVATRRANKQAKSTAAASQ